VIGTQERVRERTQAHHTSHVNSPANDGSRQMYGNINNNTNYTIHPFYGIFAIPQDPSELIVEERIEVE
jgi:hypothetical protein